MSSRSCRCSLIFTGIIGSLGMRSMIWFSRSQRTRTNLFAPTTKTRTFPHKAQSYCHWRKLWWELVSILLESCFWRRCTMSIASSWSTTVTDLAPRSLAVKPTMTSLWREGGQECLSWIIQGLFRRFLRLATTSRSNRLSELGKRQFMILSRGMIIKRRSERRSKRPIGSITVKISRIKTARSIVTRRTKQEGEAWSIMFRPASKKPPWQLSGWKIRWKAKQKKKYSTISKRMRLRRISRHMSNVRSRSSRLWASARARRWRWGTSFKNLSTLIRAQGNSWQPVSKSFILI